MCGQLLIPDPGIELLWRVDIHAEQHHRVLRTAELGALAEVEPGFPRIQPHRIHMIRDQICLSSQLWDPEAMVDICGSQLEEGRFWRGVGTGWNVEFVRSDHAIFWVSELPPELMPDHRDIESCLWFWRVLNREDDACRRKEQDDHDQDRDHGPRQFNLRAAVDLSWLALRIAFSCPKPIQGNDEQPANNEEYCSGNCDDKDRQIEDLMRGC